MNSFSILANFGHSDFLLLSLSLAALSLAVFCWLWALDDPLYQHMFYKVPLNGGFLAYALSLVLTILNTSKITAGIIIVTCVFLFMVVFLHQKHATAIILRKQVDVTKLQFFVTESILIVYFTALIVMGIFNVMVIVGFRQ
jgi:hypothetical protein